MTETKKRKGVRKAVVITCIVLGILLLLYLIGGYFIIKQMLDNSFAKLERAEYYTTYPTYEDFKDVLPREQINFLSGGNKLQGFIYGSDNDKGLIIVVHGFGGSSDDYLPQIQFLVDKGWRVFAYDGTGVYESEGDSRMSFYQATIDLVAALDYVNSNASLSSMPLALFGHSQGGFAVCSSLNYEQAENVDAAISVAGLNTAGDIVEASAKEMVGGLYFLGKPFLLMLDNSDFGDSYTSVQGINKSNAAVMLIQGDRDSVIPPDEYAITHYKDEITNLNVEYVFCTDEWNNGHNNILTSEAAWNYTTEVNAAWDEYKTTNDITNATNDDLQSFSEEYSVDKLKLYEVNGPLFEQINVFLENNIHK
ncbi:MAG: lysophospholipase [Clostridiales bacterium]|jgi:pimeloyl-ACP methyl ester carboxylesterase|nr:lysophospholipase [Clostridiales bacterium]